ncbi:type II toxin-antitoxin system RelE/ParE family toxin [Brevundimonas sp. SL130]|uniref:type II toxin-antitoxin system RelE/ParE family toxin n=1 Tax=Brevundimonas sp. SL130 TaxID=2995143 RepID=UPI00226CFE73|nr:type II toxin-antitoxin system RelE/ParE family toxin [Brevundimonas sp. SL130]WAC60776.1 type II toxin-antitoxin system RelE/ParE family toxin [Brevundimonas sp. SL130]
MRRRNTLIVTERARRDLGQAREWLTQAGSGARGRSRYAALLAALQDLKTAPTRWPFGENPNVREHVREGYRFFYEWCETDHSVTILRIYGPFQDRAAL